VTRRVIVAVTLLLVSADFVAAQIIRPQPIRTTPLAWTSLAIGWLQQQGFCDRDTGDCWDFGSSPQWRASLEMPLGAAGTTTVGIAGTLSRMSLIYNGTALGTNSCVGCDATANISQVLGALRMGGSVGFHQVIDLAAGMTMFSNFRRRDNGNRLGTGKMTQNFTFAVAYGFGYGFSPRTQIAFTQEYALQFLPRQAGDANNVAQQATLRLGVRVGLGERRR
jgi:hypothetical protein